MPYFPIPEHRPTPASPFDIPPTRVNTLVHADDPLYDAWKLILAAKQFLTDGYNYDAYGHKAPLKPHATMNTEPKLSEDIRNMSDAEIFSLTQNLKDQLIAAHPLVAPTVPLIRLRSEYASPTYLAQIDWLSSHGWTGLRRARGDGDCFYRSMAFAYVERILNAPDLPLAVATSLSTIEGRLADLRAYEDFYEALRDLVLNIVEPDVQGKVLTSATLLQRFQDPEGKLY
ncbi:hypothetical protein BS47DRAFT_1390504 [Hydnum rufescens UP504]|uniref:Ubiquitinyl hydrolase 1 n=1 Tax=Hydnum rufescens UP504 TaxID=1448309 RepID=A0A9P6B2R6_9AGAM|nr:hypothetical protein BS47DRAFT_1390504 [Hydnum rufescens UP504]